MGYRVGVDIGGSFTDFAVLNEQTHQIHTLKVLSRPDQPGSEILTGLSQLQQRDGIEPQHIDYFTLRHHRGHQRGHSATWRAAGAVCHRRIL